MKELSRQRLIYILSDWLMLNVGISAFYVVRFLLFSRDDSGLSFPEWAGMPQVYGGQILFPLLMVGVFAIAGFYNRSQLFYKSRLDEFSNTAGSTFVGMLIIFFLAIVNDKIGGRILSYELMLTLWMCMFIPVYVARVVITTYTLRRLRKDGQGWRTLIVGITPSAIKEMKRIDATHHRTGRKIVGFIDPKADKTSDGVELEGLPVYGMDLTPERIKHELNAHSIIIMPHPSGMSSTLNLINRLYPLDIPILIPLQLHQLIAMRPRLSSVTEEPLVDITNAYVPSRVSNMKRMSDIAVSSIGLILLIPVYLAIAAAIKLTSKGPVIYSQERIGFHKKPFRILKFRTMNVDAEDLGPALSSEDDTRVTKIGHFLRKYRLDELPQLWNVLAGDMSLVGPRPERKYYIDQIVKEVPAYSLIHQVRPGITSWGMVRYGYAKSVDEMIERLRYDLLYIDNVSFSVDLKILYHTIHTVLAGKGM